MSLDFGDLILTGKEVILRPLNINDSAALARASSESRENYKFNPIPNGLDEAIKYVSRAINQRDKGERFPFAIIWNGRIVGTTSYADCQQWSWPSDCALQRQETPDVLEIGYTWLAQSAQRTRCNSEAKLLILSHAFDSWKVHRVSFRTNERNTMSRRAIERLGAKFEGIRRADMPGMDNAVRNSAFYSIISSEWPEVKSQIIERL